MSNVESIFTKRLELRPASVEELDALIVGDPSAFESVLGATVPEPLEAPPETADVIEWFRDAIADDPGIRPWFFRWVIDRQEGKLVGSIGFAGRPDPVGTVLLGYSVYPDDQRKGYASEAAAGIVQWALAQPEAHRVQATIRPGHKASRRVAAKAGLQHVGELETEEEGIAELWEIVRPLD
jgi:ribosomal-protein-alanine N-acetyltransferase